MQLISNPIQKMPCRLLAVAIMVCLISTGCVQDSENMTAGTQAGMNIADSVSSSRIDTPEAVTSEVAVSMILATGLPRGTYGWNPVHSLPNAVWSGNLVINDSCVYLDVSHRLDDSQYQDGYTIPEDELLLSFVRLPEPLTKFNPETEELWVGESGPISSGDEVTIIGSEGWQQQWGYDDWQERWSRTWSSELKSEAQVFEYSGRSYETDCIAHVSFYAVSLNLSEAGDSNNAFNFTRSQLLAGLVAWDQSISNPEDNPQTYLFLVIEPPCVYGIPLINPNINNQDTSRIALRLHRPKVRFKSDENIFWNNYRLWFGNDDPLTNGDIVAWNGYLNPMSSELRMAGCSAKREANLYWLHHFRRDGSPPPPGWTVRASWLPYHERIRDPNRSLSGTADKSNQ